MSCHGECNLCQVFDVVGEQLRIEANIGCATARGANVATTFDGATRGDDGIVDVDGGKLVAVFVQQGEVLHIHHIARATATAGRFCGNVFKGGIGVVFFQDLFNAHFGSGGPDGVFAWCIVGSDDGVGVTTNQNQAGDFFILTQGQNVVVVQLAICIFCRLIFQQNRRTNDAFQGDGGVVLCIDLQTVTVDGIVHIGAFFGVEHASGDTVGEDANQGLFHSLQGQDALIHGIDGVLVEVGSGTRTTVQVGASVQGIGRGRNATPVAFIVATPGVLVGHIGDGTTVGDNVTAKAPLLPHQGIQQIGVATVGHTVGIDHVIIVGGGIVENIVGFNPVVVFVHHLDAVVARHNRLHIGVLDGPFVGEGVVFQKVTFGDVGGVVATVCFTAVGGNVLGTCDGFQISHPIVAGGVDIVCPLQAIDKSFGNATRQEGVFAIGFVGTTPIRVFQQVDRWCVVGKTTGGGAFGVTGQIGFTGFVGDGQVHLFDQIHIPSTALCQTSGDVGGIAVPVATASQTAVCFRGVIVFFDAQTGNCRGNTSSQLVFLFLCGHTGNHVDGTFFKGTRGVFVDGNHFAVVSFLDCDFLIVQGL